MTKMSLKLSTLLLLGVFALFAAKPSKDTVLGEYKTYNNERKIITKQELDEKIKKIPPMYKSRFLTVEGQQRILKTIGTEAVFEQEALALDLEKDEKIKKNILNASKPVINGIYFQKEFDIDRLPEDELKEYYDTHNKDFMTRRSISVRYIQTENKKSGKKAVKKLKKGADFNEIMNEYSINKEAVKKQGLIENIRGNGFIVTVGKDKKLDDAIKNADLDKWVGPIKTDTGWHVFNKIRHEEPELKDFKSVAKRIFDKLRPKYQKEKQEARMAELMKKYEVVIDTAMIASEKMNSSVKVEEKDNAVVVSIPKLNLEWKHNDILKKFKKIPPQERQSLANSDFRNKIVRRDVENELVYADALEKGYDEDPSVIEQMKDIKRGKIISGCYDKVVTDQVVLTEDLMKKYYEDNKEKYKKNKNRKIQLFAFASEEEASRMKKQIAEFMEKGDNEAVRNLVNDNSVFPKNYGIIEKVYPNGIVSGYGKDQKLNEMIWNAELNKLSKIVQDQKGNCVFFKVLDETPESYKSFEDVILTIKMNLKRKMLKAKFEEVEAELDEKYSLKLYPEKLVIRLTAKELFDLAAESQKKRKYKDAVNYYNQILKNYNETDGYRASFMIGFLYSEELKDNETAKKYFNSVINDYPKSDLHESAEFMLKSINGEVDIFQESGK
ncbi:MAG: hypothetical protein CSB55_02845 [Candidatus Cloacimonadota bacterium]|nr:MAG: hypothetical protein CSB55_02845 [Candidatus Cloacimonadota bacterium]